MWHSISWFLYVLHYFFGRYTVLAAGSAVLYCKHMQHCTYIICPYSICICCLHILSAVWGLSYLRFFFFIFYLWAKFVSYSISWSAWVQLKTWWNTGEIHKPGENLVKTWCFTFNPTGVYKLDENLVKIWWKPGENLVKFLNLVKTWWISQTWWKFSETSNNSINFVKKCRKQNKNGEHLVKT